MTQRWTTQRVKTCREMPYRYINYLLTILIYINPSPARAPPHPRSKSLPSLYVLYPLPCWPLRWPSRRGPWLLVLGLDWSPVPEFCLCLVELFRWLDIEFCLDPLDPLPAVFHTALLSFRPRERTPIHSTRSRLLGALRRMVSYRTESPFLSGNGTTMPNETSSRPCSREMFCNGTGYCQFAHSQLTIRYSAPPSKSSNKSWQHTMRSLRPDLALDTGPSFKILRSPWCLVGMSKSRRLALEHSQRNPLIRPDPRVVRQILQPLLCLVLAHNFVDT